MTSNQMTRVGASAVLATLVGLVGGCSQYGTGEVTTSVTSDSESCVVTKQLISAGPVTFKIENKGPGAASYEVRGEGDGGEFTDKIMGVEKVAAGADATMSGKLGTGQFQVRCLLASGDTPAVAIRTSVDGAPASRVDLEPAILRFTVTRDGAVHGPPPLHAEVGDVVTFALDNRSDRATELTVRGPDGEQTAAVSAGARTRPEASAILRSAGTYEVRLGKDRARFSLDVSS